MSKKLSLESCQAGNSGADDDDDYVKARVGEAAPGGEGLFRLEPPTRWRLCP